MGDFFAELPGNEEIKLRNRSLGPQGIYLDQNKDYCAYSEEYCTCNGVIYYSTWDAMMNDADNQRFSTYKTNETESIHCFDDIFYDEVYG
jgi:hypothetical protein